MYACVSVYACVYACACRARARVRTCVRISKKCYRRNNTANKIIILTGILQKSKKIFHPLVNKYKSDGDTRAPWPSVGCSVRRSFGRRRSITARRIDIYIHRTTSERLTGQMANRQIARVETR